LSQAQESSKSLQKYMLLSSIGIENLIGAGPIKVAQVLTDLNNTVASGGI